jgi:quinol monooxygenase YgiN
MLLTFILVLASIALTVDSFSIGSSFGPKFLLGTVTTPFRPRQSKIEMKYCLNVKLSVNPAKREEFLAAIRTNAKGTLSNEPGCRGYLWGESATSPNVFHFQEQFDNKESFLEHTKAPHFQVWEAFAQQSDAFTAPPIIDFFDEMK